jgi:hypothetical protein
MKTLTQVTCGTHFDNIYVFPVPLREHYHPLSDVTHSYQNNTSPGIQHTATRIHSQIAVHEFSTFGPTKQCKNGKIVKSAVAHAI